MITRMSLRSLTVAALKRAPILSRDRKGAEAHKPHGSLRLCVSAVNQ